MSLPILYSYRRCPYAMRARMALWQADIAVEVREIALWAKPAHMLAVSPKGTVPVLVLPAGQVIDESIDIMHWALQMRDPQGWLLGSPEKMHVLIAENDSSFKRALDRYKYADRYPEYSADHYRGEGELFIAKLEQHIALHGNYLLDVTPTLADVAIFPFVRQFAMVDPAWFDSAPYPRVRQWLHTWLSSSLFESIMKKYPTWQE